MRRKKRGRRSESNSFESYQVEEKDFDGKPKKCKLKAQQMGSDDDEPDKLDIDQKKDGWREGQWDRKWKHDDFKTEFK